MIQITSKQAGFRRCGIAHPAVVTEYPDATFTSAQLEALKNEPMLVVQVVEEEDKGTKRPNAKDSIAAVKAAATLEELAALTEGEDRQSVLDAITKRQTELEAPKE